jgi:hypothetical protein
MGEGAGEEALALHPAPWSAAESTDVLYCIVWYLLLAVAVAMFLRAAAGRGAAGAGLCPVVVLVVRDTAASPPPLTALTALAALTALDSPASIPCELSERFELSNGGHFSSSRAWRPTNRNARFPTQSRQSHR